MASCKSKEVSERTSSTSAVSDLASALAGVLDVKEISGLRRLSGGASRETWMFGADGQNLILQRARHGAVRQMSTETSLLIAAGRHGVPVPAVVVDGSRSDALERPFMIVRHVEGETIARKILRDEQFATARQTLARQMARAAATLHQIDPGEIDGLTADDQVVQYRAVLDQLSADQARLYGTHDAHPVFEIAFRWLENNRPPMSRRAVVHGDFRLGNMMVNQSGLAAVLDWELAHIGDPMEDLGWMCVRAWRFGGDQPAAGVGSYDDICDAYAEIAGFRPDRDSIRWWEVLGTLKWGIMCIMQAQTHLSGTVRSHELAAIGRRVCENEWDLINLLEEVL